MSEKTSSPIPKGNLREKTSTWETWTKEDGKHLIRIERITKRFDLVLREWKIVKTDVSYIEPSERGYVKSLTFSIIIKRIGYDSHMRESSVYILQPCKFTVPKVEEYKSIVLKLVQPSYYKKRFERGRVVMCDMSVHVSQPLDIIHKWLKEDGKEKLISEKEARRILKNCEALGIWQERGGRLTVCASFASA